MTNFYVIVKKAEWRDAVTGLFQREMLLKQCQQADHWFLFSFQERQEKGSRNVFQTS